MGRQVAADGGRLRELDRLPPARARDARRLPRPRRAPRPAFSAAYRASLRRMFEFVRHYTRPDGLAPLIGDADDGRMVILELLLRLAAAGPPLPAGPRRRALRRRRPRRARAGAPGAVEEVAWLLGPDAARRLTEQAPPARRAAAVARVRRLGPLRDAQRRPPRRDLRRRGRDGRPRQPQAQRHPRLRAERRRRGDGRRLRLVPLHQRPGLARPLPLDPRPQHASPSTGSSRTRRPAPSACAPTPASASLAWRSEPDFDLLRGRAHRLRAPARAGDPPAADRSWPSAPFAWLVLDDLRGAGEHDARELAPPRPGRRARGAVSLDRPRPRRPPLAPPAASPASSTLPPPPATGFAYARAGAAILVVPLGWETARQPTGLVRPPLRSAGARPRPALLPPAPTPARPSAAWSWRGEPPRPGHHLPLHPLLGRAPVSQAGVHGALRPGQPRPLRRAVVLHGPARPSPTCAAWPATASCARASSGAARTSICSPRPAGLPKWTDPRVERLNYRWFAGVVRCRGRRARLSRRHPLDLPAGLRRTRSPPSPTGGSSSTWSTTSPPTAAPASTSRATCGR